MRRTPTTSWVVYRMVVHKQQVATNAICEQAEWDAWEAAEPGLRTLVRGGITNEGVAERLARGTSGDTKPRMTRGRIGV